MPIYVIKVVPAWKAKMRLDLTFPDKILNKCILVEWQNHKKKRPFLFTAVKRKVGEKCSDFCGKPKKMVHNLVKYDFASRPIHMRWTIKTFARVDRSIRNNLVKFADNLPFFYYFFFTSETPSLQK